MSVVPPLRRKPTIMARASRKENNSLDFFKLKTHDLKKVMLYEFDNDD